MKKLLPIFIMLILSAIISFGYPLIVDSENSDINVDSYVNDAKIAQKILGINETPKTIYKLYDAGELVGILANLDSINALLVDVYDMEFVETYPDSSIDLGSDLYLASEMSYYEFENVDEAICNYIKQKDAYTIEAYSIEFSDDNGVYANIFVQNLDIYQDALYKYLSFFVDADSLNVLLNNQSLPELNTYGTRDTSIQIVQNIKTSKVYAPSNEVYTTADQIFEYLKYGDNQQREYYTVQQYDTVAGVGSKNHGLSAKQIMDINSDVIKSVDQVLEEGMQLCVTYFTPPIDVVVTKENLKREAVYSTETLYIEDPTIREGKEEIRQQGEAGSQNALYEERWENGILVSGKLISSVVTIQPIQEIVARGTMVIPGVGTGTFRWPVDNPVISCAWGCYSGHRAIDIINAYERYGYIYAADRGTVITNAYQSINGNYMIIDHGNGFQTYYGHMNTPGYFAEGETVDKGDIIGQIGMTGSASGPHVHFFIMENGERRNPCNRFLDCY